MKLDLIKELHEYLSEDFNLVKQKIFSCSHPSEELIGIVSDHLINAGGKRIRPIVTILTAKSFGYEEFGHVNLAASVEFIHAATLLHDDVVDGSGIRHKQKTANFLWGNKASILVGDFLFSQAFKLMVQTNSLEALEVLSSASAIIAEGEVRQLRNQGNFLSEEEYYRIISAKTAELFSASAASGAIIAGVSKDKVAAMRLFGLNLGLIFQIRDDLLDYFGDVERLGKSVGQDFMEGKCTLPIILAFKQPNLECIKLLQDLFEKGEEDGFLYSLEILQKLDIESQINERVEQLKSEAIEALDYIKISNQNVDYLRRILDFAADRCY